MKIKNSYPGLQSTRTSGGIRVQRKPISIDAKGAVITKTKTAGTRFSNKGASQSAARNPSTTDGIDAIVSMVGFTTARKRGVLKLGSVERCQQRDRNREQHCKHGPLDAAENQWNHRQLGLEFIAAPSGLPDVIRPRGTLIPNLAEEGLHARFRVWIVQFVEIKRARLVQRQ